MSEQSIKGLDIAKPGIRLHVADVSGPIICSS